MDVVDRSTILNQQYPKTNRRNTSRLKIWVVVFLAATLVALTYATRNAVASVSAGRPIDWLRQVSFEFLYWYVWAAFTPLILWFAGSFDPEHTKPRRIIAALAAFGLLIASLQSVVEWSLALTILFLRRLPGEDFSVRVEQAKRGILIGIFSNIIIYSLIVIGHFSYDYFRRYRERKLRTAELEGRLAKAELQNLKAQLQPHFLFNTLHTISVLMMRDPETANRTLVRLSDLLRLSLDHVGSQEISLKQEMEFLNSYLEIEQTRFQDRLTINRRIDPATLDSYVPNLILQPLVENAIRHGIAKQPGAGTVEIRSKRIDGSLQLEIQDTGPGLPPSDSSLTEGVGLANTRSRLQHLYGSKHRFELNNAPEGGVVVSILIPYCVYEEHK